MPDFEDLKKGLAKNVTKINLKTSNFFEEQKIKTYIATLNNEVKELEARIANIAYQEWEKENFELSHIESFLEEIKEKTKAISEQEQKIMELQKGDMKILGTNKVEDTQGGSEKQIQQEVNDYLCPNCGSVYPTKINFCRKCGSKMNN